MAKSKKQPRPVRRGAANKKKTQSKQIFGLTFNISYNELVGSYKARTSLTGGRWIGQTVRVIGNVLRSRVLTGGALAALVAVLARMAS